MVGPFEYGGSPIRVRFQALKDELKHLVLSISEDYDVQGGDPYASMAAFDRAKKVLSVMRELKGLLAELSPLPNATSSAHFMLSRGNEHVGSPRDCVVSNSPTNGIEEPVHMPLVASDLSHPLLKRFLLLKNRYKGLLSRTALPLRKLLEQV